MPARPRTSAVSTAKSRPEVALLSHLRTTLVMLPPHASLTPTNTLHLATVTAFVWEDRPR